ncbi:MAG: hypothetical protein V1761_03805 [bacterium]
MLIKRIKNSRLLQLAVLILAIGVIFGSIVLIRNIPMYLPDVVDINQDAVVSGSSRTVAISGNDIYYFADGLSGKGIYLLADGAEEPVLVVAVEAVDAIAANASFLYFATPEADDYSIINQWNIAAATVNATTDPIRFLKGIGAIDGFLFFQGCIENENTCNSVSAIVEADVVDELIDEEFRIYKNDIVDNEHPDRFCNRNFDSISTDPTNPKLMSMYINTTEIPGYAITYIAIPNPDQATVLLYPLIMSSVDIYHVATGQKIVASTSNEISFYVSATRQITRLQNYARLSGTTKYTRYQLAIFASLIETKVHASVNYIDHYPELYDNDLYFSFGSPYSADHENLTFVGTKWNNTSDTSIFEMVEKRHLEDVVLNYVLSTGTLSIVYTTVEDERIIGRTGDNVYLYSKGDVLAYDIVSGEKTLVYHIGRFTVGKTLNIDFVGDFLIVYTSDYRYVEKIDLS